MIEKYAYGTSRGLICKKEKIKRDSIIKQYKKINFDYITKKDIKENNSKWSQTPDHPYRIIIIGGSGSGQCIA